MRWTWACGFLACIASLSFQLAPSAVGQRIGVMTLSAGPLSTGVTITGTGEALP
jgi:hypothetical protein